MIRVAHVVNPFRAPQGSDLDIAQPITFESMRVAREFAQGRVNVELYAAMYPDDADVSPEGFLPTPPLDRSILDLGEHFDGRRLPLLADILERLHEASDADHLVYTNVDIALMPHFYAAVAELIEQAHDAIVINRREISDRYRTISELPLMYAEIGVPHEGWDCFVFSRSIASKLDLGTVCLGAPRVGRTLAGNLVCRADRFIELREAHLTFHRGVAGSWDAMRATAEYEHNRRQFEEVRRRLTGEFGPFPENDRRRWVLETSVPRSMGRWDRLRRRFQESPMLGRARRGRRPRDAS